MNPITGKTEIEVAGERRSIVCDMNAAAVLYDRYGEHWTLWLLERFAGKPVAVAGGKKFLKQEPLGPSDLMTVLFALLATDRATSRRVEDEVSLGSSFTLGDYARIQVEITRCVLVSFGVPGEAFEVDGGAASGPRGSARAATDGTGTQS